MKVAKVISLLGVIAMTGVLIFGFTVGDFAEDGGELLSNPWGIVSLVDLYVGFILFSGWIVYRENSLARSIFWVILMMVLGFFTGALTHLSPFRPAVMIGAASLWEPGPTRMNDKRASSPNKFKEIIEEFRSVMQGRGGWADSLIPPLVFIILNAAARFEVALWGAFGVALLIAVFRLAKGQSVRYALGGILGVILAMIIARLVGGAQGYFLPGIVTGFLTVALCFLSLLVKRPLVAFTSALTRRWSLEWYWHPLVRPAYGEVTLVWGIFFTIRTLLQLYLYWLGESAVLGVVQVILGWPAIILLLAASYLYGFWRLGSLHGPSVDELKLGAAPPWEGQKRGF